MPSRRTTPRADEVVTWLEEQGSESVRAGLARYAISADRAFGIPVGTLQRKAKELGRDHALAEALWLTGWYEARMLSAFVDDPDAVTARQMDRWCRDFDNWAICDTLCFHLFDRSPLAWGKVDQWAKRREEFIRRAAFALLASLALHQKGAPEDAFLTRLPLIEAAADDGRNFVKKAVSWALRAIGKRSEELRAAAIELAQGLAALEGAARWVGKDALRDLSRPAKKPAR